jgi:hypothetical protein
MTNDGRTPLLYTARSGHKAVVELLLNKNAIFDFHDCYSDMPLSYAARNGQRLSFNNFPHIIVDIVCTFEYVSHILLYTLYKPASRIF